MDAAKEALFLAQFHVERAAQTGFAQGACAVGGRYFLSGPLVGHADPWVPAHPERIWITPAEVPDLIWDLNGAGGGGARWAAAVIDNGASVVLANDLAATYIPCGVHLPSNATIVIGQPDDGLYWQYYGWPPAERLAAYAQKHGWLDRISTMVAQTIEDRMIDPPHKRYTSPFEWVRPMLGCDGDHIEFIELEPAPDRRIDRHGFPWGWPSRGGQHRLQIVDPDRYTQLHEHVLASPDVVRQTLTTAAELVVEGAQRARNSQILWIGGRQATSDTGVSGEGSGVMSTGRSRSLPLWNSAPARTSATSCGALTARHRDCAASISL